MFQLPLSLQLIAGGSDSIRGFDFQSIGPGKRKYVVSLEVQQQVVENWFVTGFGDLGYALKKRFNHINLSTIESDSYVKNILRNRSYNVFENFSQIDASFRN